MIYRPEIDGLRALAVIPVILFHAGFELFSAGFAGVDVFFVISGYLITSIIITEQAEGRFTLAGFYERRARRILPALFFILLVCLPFAWLLLLPHELIGFGKSLVAVSVFVSNILFWRESDYFAADAEAIPLLHTWSLAVEEQFYVFFPVLLVLLWKFGKPAIIKAVALIAVCSLALTEWGWRNAADANFYLIPFRAWELMIGAIIAFHMSRNPSPNRPIAQFAGITGIGSILFFMLFFDRTIPFPSLYALIPVMGTALVILFANNETIAGKLLANKVFVFIGLISYSAYLWHQPLFVFARLGSANELGPTAFAALSALSLLLAWLSWRWIEKPFRNREKFSRIQIFSFSALGTLLFIIAGISLVASDGAAFRYE